MTTTTPRLRACLAAATLLIAAWPAARADEQRQLPGDMPKAYTQECAACHTAYPPGMLPQASWRRIMAGLDRHYGVDASLDTATLRQLDGWLQTHAGTARRVREAPPQDRITRSAWFERKHRDFDPAVWRHASVRSAANCAACHPGAERGDYDDDRLRMPAGLPQPQRRAGRD
jgi:mono/diheme cytochrome c family protein